MGHKVTGNNVVENAILLKEVSAPSATTGYGTLYVKSSNSKLAFKDASGTEIEVGASSAYDRDTLLLLPLTGTDGQTRNIKDSSQYNHTVIVQGNAQIDTAQYKFGDSSLLLDGAGDKIYVPQHSVFQFGYDDFTLECWVRLATDISTSTDDARRLIAGGRLENYVGTWCWGYGHHSSWGTNKRMNFAIKDPTGSVVQVYSNEATMAKDTWYHMACVRYAGVIKFYLDGACINGTGTTRAELIYDKGYGADRYVNIGARGNLSNDCFECHNGWLADVRISKVARYTADFTPATGFLSPYET